MTNYLFKINLLTFNYYIMFQKTYEFKQVKREMMQINALNKYSQFECFSDNIATFSYIDGDVYHEFSIITDDNFDKSMLIFDLLNLKNISYFQHKIYIKNNNFYEKIGGLTWVLYQNISIN